jgi:hypothetical protein
MVGPATPPIDSAVREPLWSRFGAGIVRAGKSVGFLDAMLERGDIPITVFELSSDKRRAGTPTASPRRT